MLSAPDRGTALYCGGVHGEYEINDVWELHLGANTWNLICPSDGGNHLSAVSARAAARRGRDPEKNRAYYRKWYRDNVVVEDGTVRTRFNRGPLSPIQTWDQLAYDHHAGKLYWVVSSISDGNRLESYCQATGQDPEKLRPLLKPGTSLWSFDPETRKWDRHFEPRPRPRTGGMGGTLRYVPAMRKLVWYVAAQNTIPFDYGMWAYDPATNRWEDMRPNGGADIEKLYTAGAVPGCHLQSAYSPKDNVLVAVMDKKTWVFSFAANEWKLTATDARNSARENRTVFAYDRDSDRFLLMHPGRAGRRKLGRKPAVPPVPGNVRAFDVASNKWRTLPVKGAPVPNGVVAGYWDPRFGVLVVQSRSRRIWVYRPGN